MADSIYGPSEGLDPSQPVEGLSIYAPDPNAPGPFARGLKTGVADLKAIGGGVLQYAGRGFGAKPLEDLGVGIQERAAAESAPYRMQVEDVGTAFDQGVGPGLGAAVDLVKYTVGNQIPMLATTIAGGVGGRLAAGALGATRAAAGVSAAERAAAAARVAAGTGTAADAAIASAVRAADIGVGAGVGAASVGMELGQIAPEGLKPGADSSMLQIATGALAAGAMDTVAPFYIARQMGLIGAATRALTPRAAGLGAVAKDIGVGAAKVGAFEGVQEAAQSAIERAAAGQPLTGAEASSDYLNSGVMGAIMGALTGGLGGGVNAMQRPIEGVIPPTVVEPPAEVPPASVPPTVPPAPEAPPTPEAIHADLTAQHAAAVAQEGELAPLMGYLQQAQQEGEAKIAALAAEAKLPPGERRVKSEILAEKKDIAAQVKEVKAKIEEAGGQLNAARTSIAALAPQVEAARRALPPAPVPEGTIPALATPDIPPRAASLGSDLLADPNLPPPTPTEHIDRAVKGVHALFREQGMPLTTTEESFATPPLTPREVALARVEQRTPREAIKNQNAAQMTAVEENAMAVIEPLARTIAETKTKTPEGQAKVAAKMVKAMRGVVQEAAKTGSVEEAQQYVAANLPAALKGHGVVADAADMAKAVNAGVGLARTQFSKGAVDIGDLSKRSASDLRGLEKQIGDMYVDGKMTDDEFRARFDPVIAARVNAELRENRLGPAKGIADVFPGFKQIPVGTKVLATHGSRYAEPTMATVVGSRSLKSSLDGMITMHPKVDFGDGKPRTITTGGIHQVYAPRAVPPAPTSESNAALTQDEFDRLPEPAQFAAVDAYNRVMRERGVALRQQLAGIIGERPELKVMTFSAEPGGPIGSYTRTGPLKAVIALATNAKEGLGVADHEGYHFAEDWLLTAAERRVVANALKEGKPLYTQLVARLQQYDRENQTSLTDEVTGTPAEARAYAFEFWRRGELKAEGPLARAWQKIKQFLERISNAVKGLGFTSIEDVFIALDRGQMAEREMIEGTGGAYQSVAGGQEWYRSALTDAVVAINTKAAPAQGWRDQIKGLVAKGVVKQVEVDAVGLNDWLDLQQGKVTKEQVVSFVKEHGVQVREVVLGDPMLSRQKDYEAAQDRFEQAEAALGAEITRSTGYTDDQWAFRDIIATARRGETLPDVDAGVMGTYAREWREFQRATTARDARSGETKFSGYQLPGGENYRELLLTLPAKQATQFFIAYKGDSTMGTGFATRQEAEAELADTFPGRSDLEVREGTGDRSTTTRVPENFRSSHFDQPNIIAHVRFNERRDADGKRVLFIEEIQSDWAQKGRKEGFSGQEKVAYQVIVNGNPAGAYESRAEAAQAVQRAARYNAPESITVREITGEVQDIKGVPSAPFVTKTEAWTALALKRMIRYAAENGFDKVAWTTGEQQAARYDLSKQVSRIEYADNGNGRYHLGAFGLDGRIAINETMDASKLEDTVGKEIAKKIVEGAGTEEGAKQSGHKVLSGIDLKVGGEGMKGYYDKIVPSVANDILKRLGGGKVGEVSVALSTPTTTPGMTRIVRDDDGTYAVEVRKFDEGGESFWEPAAYGLTKEDAEARRLFGGQVPAMQQPGFTLTAALAERAAFGLPLFSKAATEKSNLMADGQLEAMQVGEQWAHLIEDAKVPNDVWARMAGIVKEDLVGGVGRWWRNEMSTPNFISASSQGFKNVYQAFNTYSRYRKILSEQLVREQMPAWYKASDADRKAAFDVMLKRTVGKMSTQSQDLANLLATLTPQQRVLYDSATRMIAGVLQRQFDSQKETRKRQLTSPGAYEKWLTNRQEQMATLLDQGYVPLRRYGDYSVAVFMEAPDGTRHKASLEFFSSPSAAKAASIAYAKEIERSGVNLKVEMGRRSKNERDTGVSLEQFLGTLRRQGIDISQAERERLVVAMTNAESIVRTQMMHREGLAGYSTDGMRVLHEFGINTTSEIAYARFAHVLDAALDGAEVTADVDSVTSEPVITIGESFGKREDGQPHNLWERDGPMSGMFKDRANAMADMVLVPDRKGVWATKLRTAAVMYFIGGSISGAAVNTLSVPMVLVPHLSIHTDYLNASMTSLKSWKDAWQHYAILRDMDRMKTPDAETAAKLDAAGITKEMRAAIVAAADHIFDTEIHSMLGISQGTLYSKSRNLQRAAEAWMTPFRVAEQTNRLASFMAAYKIATTGDGVRQADGSFKRLSGQELFRFAGGVVDATQNNYNENNRPGIMSNPVGALLFQFKSFPLFIMEAIALMYKANPKSAVYMLLGLVAMSGVQGLPFAEEILNLVDVISQRLFNSPFNSRRAMRNAVKSASDALGVVDLSDAFMRGLVNEITGVNVATRVSSGLLPGTRLGAADADQGRVLSEIAGAPYSMVRDTLANIGGLVGGVATGDWQKAADALRAGGPIAVRNAIKGAEQLSQGYATDSKGRKLADVTTLDGLLQLTGLSSATVAKMNDLNSIIIQTKAFHTQVSQDMQNQLVKAYRDGDQERIRQILDLRAKWNEQNPTMPIMSNSAATRRAIIMAGVPLDRREQMLLGRRMAAAFSDVTGQMAE